MHLPPAMQRLTTQLARLPGVGERSAQRLCFHLLRDGRDNAQALAASLASLHDHVRFCIRCHNLAANERCAICADPRRDQGTICVVEGIPDLIAVEQTGEFRGTYHVLGGVLSPLRGVGPEELQLVTLAHRVATEEPGELIIALPVSVEGEATAAYLQRLIGRPGLGLTRIASGVPQGADLEYLDQATLGRALRARTPL